MQIDISKIKFDSRGLVPAVVVDVRTNDVVMLAYMNEESLLKTLETGYTWFWSRSRQELKQGRDERQHAGGQGALGRLR